MGTGLMNIWVKNIKCVPLDSIWRLDLVVQTCDSTYLTSFFNAIEQLQQKYSVPAYVKNNDDWPVASPAGDLIFTVNIVKNSGTDVHTDTITLTSTDNKLEAVIEKINATAQFVTAFNKGGVLVVETKERGWNVSLSVSGPLTWLVPVNGDGHKVEELLNYQGATRISIQPPSGQKINHVELDVPPGCYKVWARCCFGKNEETNIALVNLKCGEHACVNLLLNEVSTCANNLVHPFLFQVVNEGQFKVEEELVPMVKGFIKVGTRSKETLVAETNYRIEEANQKGDSELAQKLGYVLNLLNVVPGCF